MQVNLRGEISYPSHPLPKNYKVLLKKWLKENPWVNSGEEVEFPLDSKILGTPTIIKDRVWITGPMTIKGQGRVTIGKYANFAENTRIVSTNHQTDRADLQGKFTVTSDISKGPIYIGNNVWCGDNVTILSGVTIGDGAVIGAGSIVTKDIPPFAVAVGSPARVVKYRFSRYVIEKLLNLSWWHWDKKTVEKNLDFFKAVINDKNIDNLISCVDYSYEKELNLLDFKTISSGKWLLDGWGIKETETIWAEKKLAEIVLKVTNPKRYTTIVVNAHSYYLPQKVTIFANRKKIGRVKIENNWGQYKLKIYNLMKGINTVRFEFEKGFVPANLNKKEKDKRTLYCNFRSIELI